MQCAGNHACSEANHSTHRDPARLYTVACPLFVKRNSEAADEAAEQRSRHHGRWPCWRTCRYQQDEERLGCPCEQSGCAPRERHEIERLIDIHAEAGTPCKAKL